MTVPYATMLRTVALIVISCYLLFSLDDLYLDIYYFCHGSRKFRSRLRIKDLDSIPPKLLAVFVAAWKEEDVIRQMLDNAFKTVNYPPDFYHVFVGVYPNDAATQNALKPLLERYRNLHMVVNGHDGPTSKGDNLNNMFRQMAAYEQSVGCRFSMVIIHDSEDIIHPTSLKLFNYLIPGYDAVQIPVLPLQVYPTIGSFFKYITSGTYADELAENHFRVMVAREAMGCFIPSAGTGYAISRETVDRLAEERGEEIFSLANLTEDYEISLFLHRMGLHTHYFFEGVQRVLASDKTAYEYIATREFFPNDFYSAVKQKSRWIYGITFQSLNMRSWWSGDMSRGQRYILLRDWKSKLGNLITLPGYSILAYMIVAFFVGLPALLPYRSVAWYLSLITTALMIERQVMRIIAVKEIYGWRSAVAGCLIPPLLPIRLVWGNIINLAATLRAWRMQLFGFPKSRPRWDKTAHHFLPADVLTRYYRRLGDLLLEKELLTPGTLRECLKESREEGALLGQTLLEKQVISERQLLPAMGELLKSGYINIDDVMINQGLAEHFPENLARQYHLFPILYWKEGMALASRSPVAPEILAWLTKQTGIQDIRIVLSSDEDISRAIGILYSGAAAGAGLARPRMGDLLVGQGLVSESHVLEAMRRQRQLGKRLGEVLVEMGIVNAKQIAGILVEEQLHRSLQEAAAVALL
jgi:adsorption protein B